MFEDVSGSKPETMPLQVFFSRNYLITEIAETERRQWFKELLLLDDSVKTGKTVWIGSDFQVQGRTG